MADPDDDEIDINARPAPLIGARIVILATICRRAFLETVDEPASAPSDDRNGERFDLQTWLITESLDADQSPTEQRLLSAPVGSLTADEITEATWRIEAVQALAWSVGLLPSLPPPWTEANGAALLSSIPAPFDSAGPFTDRLTLRDDESLAGERERAELWLWRSSLAAEFATAAGNQRRTLHSAIAETARAARASGTLAATDRDFLVDDVELQSIPAAVIDRITAVSAERLHALNWVCGFGEHWDSVPLDV